MFAGRGRVYMCWTHIACMPRRGRCHNNYPTLGASCLLSSDRSRHQGRRTRTDVRKCTFVLRPSVPLRRSLSIEDLKNEESVLHSASPCPHVRRTL
jgi:hypothetical protein